MQEELKDAQEGDTDLDKKVDELGELNELAYKDLIPSISTSFPVGRVAIGLAKNAKSPEFPEGNCKIVWDQLVNKYVSHNALSM